MNSPETPAVPDRRDPLPPTVIALMKGVLERELSPETWQDLMGCTSRVRDYFGVIRLDLVLDEAEGFAYLRQRPEREGETPLPRLVPRRPLSYPVSLLLALLRKRLAEADASGGSTKLVLERGEIQALLQHVTKEVSNDKRRVDKINIDINKVVDLGFLRPIKGDREAFEVRRILTAFIDAQWLGTFEERLAAYVARARGTDQTDEA